MVAAEERTLLTAVAVLAVLSGIMFVIASTPFTTARRTKGWRFAVLVSMIVVVAVFAWLLLLAQHNEFAEGFVDSTTGATRATGNVTLTLPVSLSAPFKQGVLAFGLTTYVTCIDAHSYSPELGKTWRNVAQTTVSTATCDGSSTVRDFSFKTNPSFSPKDGFALGTNTLTGPYSHQLGLNCDQSLSILILGRLTGDVSSPISMFKLFANTPNNNGLTLTLSDGSRVGTLIKAKATVTLGNLPPIACTTAGNDITYDPRHKYVWIVAKDYGRLRVLMIDVDADTFERTTLLDTTVGAHDSIRLSNVDMTINSQGTWNGNIFAFGLYSRALDERDASSLYDVYKTTFRAFDPEYIALQARLSEADRLRSCPYDSATCAACGGITDWTNPTLLLANGGTPCLRQIDSFCTANPQHGRCSCWSTSNPDYDTTCRVYRSVFSGVQPKLPTIPTIPSNTNTEDADDGSSDDEHSHLDSMHRRRSRHVDVDSITRLISVIDARRDSSCGHHNHGKPGHKCKHSTNNDSDSDDDKQTKKQCKHQNHGKPGHKCNRRHDHNVHNDHNDSDKEDGGDVHLPVVMAGDDGEGLDFPAPVEEKKKGFWASLFG